MSERRSVWMMAALCVCSMACTTPATELVVDVGSDIAVERVRRIEVRVRRQGTSEWKSAVLTEGRQVRWPFSFALVPASRETRERALEWAISVEFADRSGVATRFERTHVTGMIAGRQQNARVFLRGSCGAPSTGCATAGVACTVAQRCDERALTCGDDGACVERALPTTEFDRDAQVTFDVRTSEPSDAAVADAAVADAQALDAAVMDATTTDVAPEASAMMDATTDIAVGADTCARSCAGRTCGDDGCGGSCGNCPMESTCTGAGQCVEARCLQPRVSVYRHANTMGIEPEYSTSATPSAGFAAGPRLFDFFATAQPGTAPMYACRHPGLAAWVSSDATCEGFPGASGTLLGHSPTSAGVCGSVWVYRFLECATTTHTITADAAERSRLRTMNVRNPCMCPNAGCRQQEEGWEGARAAFF